MINKILKFFHVHNHWHKIVASKYVSFNYRDIVGECRCGHRKLIEDVHHDCVFPFITNFITYDEMKLVADGKLDVRREFSPLT
jgi:hypothetical protein